MCDSFSGMQDAAKVRGNAIAVSILREHTPELRRLFVNAMDSHGTASLSQLTTYVAEEAEAWGISSIDVESILHPARLFTGTL